MSEDQQTEPIRSEESNDNIGEQPSTSNDNRTETDDSVFTTMINYLQVLYKRTFFHFYEIFQSLLFSLRMLLVSR